MPFISRVFHLPVTAATLLAPAAGASRACGRQVLHQARIRKYHLFHAFFTYRLQRKILLGESKHKGNPSPAQNGREVFYFSLAGSGRAMAFSENIRRSVRSSASPVVAMWFRY